MKKLLSFLLILSIIGCSKEEIEKQRGTQLLSITTHNNTKSFIYDEQDRLVQVKGAAQSSEIKNFLYNEDGTVRRINFLNNPHQVIDTFTYNSDGHLIESMHYNLTFAGKPNLIRILRFDYDDKGNVIEKRSYDEDDVLYRIEQFDWKGNNIKRYRHYSYYHLDFENTISYDNKKNYKKDNPNYITDPLDWNTNNIVKIESDVHNSLLDPWCDPCLNEYKYNRDSYPVEISNDGGQPVTLTYN